MSKTVHLSKRFDPGVWATECVFNLEPRNRVIWTSFKTSIKLAVPGIDIGKKGYIDRNLVYDYSPRIEDVDIEDGNYDIITELKYNPSQSEAVAGVPYVTSCILGYKSGQDKFRMRVQWQYGLPYYWWINLKFLVRDQSELPGRIYPHE